MSSGDKKNLTFILIGVTSKYKQNITEHNMDEITKLIENALAFILAIAIICFQLLWYFLPFIILLYFISSFF